MMTTVSTIVKSINARNGKPKTKLAFKQIQIDEKCAILFTYWNKIRLKQAKQKMKNEIVKTESFDD